MKKLVFITKEQYHLQLLTLHCCPGERTWHCGSTLLRPASDRDSGEFVTQSRERSNLLTMKMTCSSHLKSYCVEQLNHNSNSVPEKTLGSLFGVWLTPSTASSPAQPDCVPLLPRLCALHTASLTAGWRLPGVDFCLGLLNRNVPQKYQILFI